MKNGLVILSVMIWVIAGFYLVVLTTLSSSEEVRHTKQKIREVISKDCSIFNMSDVDMLENNSLQNQNKVNFKKPHLPEKHSRISYSIRALNLPRLSALTNERELKSLEVRLSHFINEQNLVRQLKTKKFLNFEREIVAEFFRYFIQLGRKKILLQQTELRKKLAQFKEAVFEHTLTETRIAEKENPTFEDLEY